MRSFAFCVSGISTILEDVDPKMFAPEIILTDDGAEIEFEWFLGAQNHVSLHFGGDYGDGMIFEFLEGELKRLDYCSRQLRESTDKLMAIALHPRTNQQ